VFSELNVSKVNDMENKKAAGACHIDERALAAVAKDDRWALVVGGHHYCEGPVLADFDSLEALIAYAATVPKSPSLVLWIGLLRS
jgi:hypothetical protein